jgi:hypothetical protein
MQIPAQESKPLEEKVSEEIASAKAASSSAMKDDSPGLIEEPESVSMREVSPPSMSQEPAAFKVESAIMKEESPAMR